MKRHEKLEEAKKSLKQLEREMIENKDISEGLAVRRVELQKEIANLNNTIRQLTPVSVGVTDHAVLRYLERYHGVSIDAVRQEIVESVSDLEDLPLKGEVQFKGFVLNNGSVITYKGPEKAAE